MRKFTGLTKRNMIVYFKDVHTVIFSLLTSIIIFVLYMLFLKSNYTDAIANAMQGLEGYVGQDDVDRFVNGLLLSGILGSALITVPFSCLGTIIKDRENSVDFDILATPIRRGQIILSYFTASALSSFVMTTIILAVGIGILSIQGGMDLSSEDVLRMIGVNFLGSISATALFMLIVLFFKSTSACGAFQGILSAAAGFVIGAYIPLSEFSETIQNFCRIFPGTGLTVLYRKLLTHGVVEHMDQSIGGLDQGKFAATLKDVFSFETQLCGKVVSETVQIGYILAVALVCTAVMVLVYGRIYKKK